jgi:GT2 family glycosyltransferase
MIKVSICIPTYTRLAYLKELVDACFRSTYTNFEICISQDVTPNGLIEEIKEFCETLVINYPKIINYKAQNNRLGLAGNWNALVKMASGEYIFMPGDDDLISFDFLDRMLKYDDLEADLIFCNQNFIDDQSNLMHDFTIKQNIRYKRNLLKEGNVNNPIAVVLHNSVPMSASLIRRSWFDKFSFDNSINTPELEFFLKIAISGGRFFYLNESLASFRIHSASATNSGLTIHKYLSNIMDINVPNEFIELKTNLVSNAIIPGINIAIKKGDVLTAKKLFYSTYYPKNKIREKIVQFIFLKLPNHISAFILKFRDYNFL